MSETRRKNKFIDKRKKRTHSEASVLAIKDYIHDYINDKVELSRFSEVLDNHFEVLFDPKLYNFFYLILRKYFKRDRFQYSIDLFNELLGYLEKKGKDIIPRLLLQESIYMEANSFVLTLLTVQPEVISNYLTKLTYFYEKNILTKDNINKLFTNLTSIPETTLIEACVADKPEVIFLYLNSIIWAYSQEILSVTDINFLFTQGDRNGLKPFLKLMQHKDSAGILYFINFLQDLYHRNILNNILMNTYKNSTVFLKALYDANNDVIITLRKILEEAYQEDILSKEDLKNLFIKGDGNSIPIFLAQHNTDHIIFWEYITTLLCVHQEGVITNQDFISQFTAIDKKNSSLLMKICYEQNLNKVMIYLETLFVAFENNIIDKDTAREIFFCENSAGFTILCKLFNLKNLNLDFMKYYLQQQWKAYEKDILSERDLVTLFTKSNTAKYTPLVEAFHSIESITIYFAELDKLYEKNILLKNDLYCLFMTPILGFSTLRMVILSKESRVVECYLKWIQEKHAVGIFDDADIQSLFLSINKNNITSAFSAFATKDKNIIKSYTVGIKWAYEKNILNSDEIGFLFTRANNEGVAPLDKIFASRDLIIINDSLNTVWDFYQKKMLSKENLRYFLLSKNAAETTVENKKSKERAPLLLAIATRHVLMLEPYLKILEKSKNDGVIEELHICHLVCTANHDGLTIFHQGALTGNIQILELLVAFIKHQLSDAANVLKKLATTKTKYGQLPFCDSRIFGTEANKINQLFNSLNEPQDFFKKRISYSTKLFAQRQVREEDIKGNGKILPMRKAKPI